MSDKVFITQADALNDCEILVNLSDGRALLLSLDQVMAANPELIPEPEADED